MPGDTLKVQHIENIVQMFIVNLLHSFCSIFVMLWTETAFCSIMFLIWEMETKENLPRVTERLENEIKNVIGERDGVLYWREQLCEKANKSVIVFPGARGGGVYKTFRKCQRPRFSSVRIRYELDYEMNIPPLQRIRPIIRQPKLLCILG